MKKKITISAALILISFAGFSQCPTYFKRNNGNGTCGAEAEIRMYFPSCPVIVPKIDSIYSTPSSACNVTTDPQAGPTPVILTSFDAQRNGSNSVAVNWRTEQEINSKGFEIQRSSDNINFESVGFVSSKTANSSLAQYYSFTDNSNNVKGTSFYRLKMVDLDNTFAFSSIKTVKGSGLQAEVNVFPNPASSNSKITVANLSESTNVRVFDNTGRLVQQISSINSNSVKLNHLQKGSYYIKITGLETGSSTVKNLSIIN